MKKLIFMISTFLFITNSHARVKVFPADTPRESIFLIFKTGAGVVPLQKQGVTEFVKKVLEKGPKGISESNFKRNLFLENAEIRLLRSSRSIIIRIKTPLENIRSSLRIALKTVRNPKFSNSVFQEIKKDIITGKMSKYEDMRSVVFDLGFKDALGYHPATFKGKGSISSLNKMKLTDVKRFYSKLLDFSNMDVFSTGKMSKVKLVSILRDVIPNFNLESPPRKKFELPDVKSLAKRSGVNFIRKPGATDNQILYSFPIKVPMGTKEYIIAKLAFSGLGGGGTGRLFEVLRGERGLTYHASSFLYQMGNNYGSWFIYSFGGIKQMPKLLEGIPEVVNKFRSKGVSSKKFDVLKKYLITSHLENNELPSDILHEVINLDSMGVDFSFFENYVDIVNSVKLEEVNDYIKKNIYLSKENTHLYVMGDYSKLSKTIKKLGLPVKKIKPKQIK